jgi:iron complex outermembrane receptor protein
MAGFANLTYDFTDQISLEAGGRYTWDKRSAPSCGRTTWAADRRCLAGGRGLWRPSTNFAERHLHQVHAARLAELEAGQQQHDLCQLSQGFKGGGFDPRGVGVNAPAGVSQGDYLSFRPEKVNSYEIGVKTRLFDRRLSLNLAAFRMDYTDVQIPGSVACTVNGLPSFCGVVSNAGKARMQGVEAEGRLKLGAVTLNGSLGYIDAKYKQYLTLINGVTTDVAAFARCRTPRRGRPIRPPTR